MVWQALEEPSTEHLMLDERADGWVAVESTVVGVIDGQPFTLRYAVQIDAGWRVRSLSAEMPFSWSRVELRSDGADNWASGDPDLDMLLRGCIDIDILVSPFTNTLPIRRLQLDVGASAEIDVVYVTVPSLQFSPRRQRYSRIDEDRYRFESLRNGVSVFTADITTDADGIVIDYPGLFRRIYPEENRA